MKTINLTWNHIEKLCDSVVQQVIRSGFKPHAILAISRGGVIPATLITHQLQITPFYAVQLTSYTSDGKQTPVKVLSGQNFPYFDKGVKVLIIDEICDSGKTIEFLQSVYPNQIENGDYRIATLITKTHKTPKHLWPTYTANNVKEPAWIMFPWEGPSDDETPF